MKWISLIATSLISAGSLMAEDFSAFPGKSAPAATSLPETQNVSRPISPGVLALSQGERQALRLARSGDLLRLPSIEAFTGDNEDTLQFQRFELFATGARAYLVTGERRTELERRPMHYFLASNRSTGIGLAVDTLTGAIRGFATRGGERLEIHHTTGMDMQFSPVEDPADNSNSCSTHDADQPPEALAFLDERSALSQSAAAAGETISYQAVVAVDADSEWVAAKQSPDAALQWISEIFLAMNVFYERDVETRLLIGDVILRGATDPYSEPSDRNLQLDEFAAHWRLNHGDIDRDFATSFSGRGIGAGSFSGIAWVNQYCQQGFVQSNGRTVGSYSFNAIGSARTTANTALFVGHEIAHNLGSRHTHCYTPAVDQCYASESGCYSGPVSCPAGGKGTIMSYCHFSTASGGANCGSSKSEFHPTVQSLLEDRLAANSPNCIAAFTAPSPEPGESLFSSGFEQP